MNENSGPEAVPVFRHTDTGTDEALWAGSDLLAQVTRISPANIGHLVVIAAHPDDETLGAGGLLARASAAGCSIKIVVATDGDASHPGSPTHTPEQLATRRRAELLAAIAAVAPRAAVSLLGLPDGGLVEHQETLTQQIRAEVAGLNAGTWVLAPWVGDGHPDHEAVGAATLEATAGLSVRVLQYPIWAWHWSAPHQLDLPGGQLQRLDLTESELAAKNAAMAAHVSQTEPLSAAVGDEAILPPGFRDHFRRPFEIFVSTEQAAPASLGSEYFDAFYGDVEDPWGFENRWYEKRKRAILLASLPRERFESGFEPGCANGTLTVELAQRCTTLLATDVTDKPVERATRRLAGRPGVTVRAGRVPDEWPDGTFDLIVISEIGYYCSPDDLAVLVDQATAALTPDGVLAVCHWRHPVADYPLGGDQVHAAFRGQSGLQAVATHEEPDFLLDVFMLAPARSVAQQAGLVD